jgi:hypothetical protein
MTNDLKKFKDMISTQLPKVGDDELISEDAINTIVENTYKARSILGLEISETEKESVRKEILSNNKILLGLGAVLVQKKHAKWFAQRKDTLPMKYWERFEQYMLQDKGMPVNVVNSMDRVSDEVVDLLGDPSRGNDGSEQRRGLIIGDVQSGKTINYSGIICKAVDAGFRTVILLTGTTNDLRQQTQIRIDEAFVGVDSNLMNDEANKLTPIGVGKFNPDPSLRPIAFTTVAKDFNKNAAKQLSMTLSQGVGERPMLFVIKKNTSVLKNLLEWIQKHNQNESNKIDNSVLMIDDEADYASVNTKAVDEDPSKTNKYIEELLNIFRFSSYVGFTATPYANIFIDPATDEEMEHEGLFPKDYIYALDAPTNYIGARNIFPVNSEYHHMLRDIEDAEDFYPMRHKKEHDFEIISDSLKDAINAFLLANVIRDLRGDKTTHRSMMINVTRFVNTQKLLHKAIKEHLASIKTSIKLYAGLSPNKALQNEDINALFVSFEQEYGSNEFSWNEVQASLFDSIMPILALVAHGGGDDLDYSLYPDGLRTIVVGGQRLSRGLTLEGLIVSYIYRNSMAYDTLMQMGRWFGYRSNYEDLCRVWMDRISQAWYAFICEATDELLEEVRVMRDKGATPLEFGLKVRNDPDIPLIVTARNKMRTAKEKIINIALSEKAIETPILYNDPAKNNVNLAATIKLIDEVKILKFGNQYGAKNIEKERVLELLENIEVPVSNVRFDPIAIHAFISQYAGEELTKWDVVLISAKGKPYEVNKNITINQINRSFDIPTGDTLRMSKKKSRIGSPSDPRFGLTDIQMDILKSRSGYLTSDSYFRLQRNPLLMIYFVNPTEEKSENYDKLADFEGTPLIGFGIGIPKLADAKTKYIKYQLTKIYQEFGGIEEYEDE